MRIVLVQRGHFSAARGGTPYQAQVLAEWLGRDANHEVVYLTRVVAPDAVGDGYRIERLRSDGWLSHHGLDAQLSRALTRINPDVIYQQGLGVDTGLAARFAERHGKPMMFHACSDYDVLRVSSLPPVRRSALQHLRKRLGEYGLQRADAVVVQTGVQGEMLQRDYGIAPAAVIRNFHPRPLEVSERGEKIRFLWVANIKPVKRPELFVELAARFVDDPRVEFAMAGAPGGRRYRAMHERIRELPNLRYLGQLQQDEVNREMAAAHVHVNTSIMEGFPNTFIQAWMRGLPVLTVGVNTDRLFDDGSMGLCAQDLDGLCRNVAALVADPERLARMGDTGRAHALAHYGMDNAQTLTDLLTRLAEGDRQPAQAAA